MNTYIIEYGINYGCHEFVVGEELERFNDFAAAIKAFIKLTRDKKALDFTDAIAEVASWDIQEGDYQYGEDLCGQINLYVSDDENDYLHLLHADGVYDTDEEALKWYDIEFGEDVTEEERILFHQYDID